MAVINDIYWNGEPIKAVIRFNKVNHTVDNYTVYMSPTETSDRFISGISFSLREGNNNVNPLGIGTSNSTTLKIFDKGAFGSF